jgi:CDP-6-deoxy-D-xylo-4-hexulose-3-dehydrase
VMQGGILLGCHHGLNDEMLRHIHSSFEVFADSIRQRSTVRA